MFTEDLKENFASEQPKPLLKVIYEASSEVRNSIVYATIIVVLVFIPLFYLQGIEGKIFAPLGIAYITSIVASLVVSLTVTPALCSYLLSKRKHLNHINLKFWKRKKSIGNGQLAIGNEQHETKKHNLRWLPLLRREAGDEADDSPLVRWLKKQDTKLLHWGLKHTKPIIGIAIALIIAAMAIVPFFGTEFLPPFNEGSFTVNVLAPAGTSLEEANKIGTIAEKQILKVPGVLSTSRRTGRAELDEHAEPPSYSEIDVSLDEERRSMKEILADIRTNLDILKGSSINIGQPISHRLDHLLSGVRAQVAIKIYGNDLNELRSNATQLSKIISDVPGVVDVQIEAQVMVPQLKIKINRDALKQYGLQAGKVAEDLEIFYNGKVVSQILEGQQSFDILIRSTDAERNDIAECW
ncbi:MAG: efflux RND transporter permease subunit [Chitinophagaceae bacterium]